MKTIKAIISVIFPVLLVACGYQESTLESSVRDIRPVMRPQGEPDFKTKDGLELLAWAKKPGVSEAICSVLREANARGFVVVSAQASEMVAQRFELHPAEAEIVAAYAQSFACPDVR